MNLANVGKIATVRVHYGTLGGSCLISACALRQTDASCVSTSIMIGFEQPEVKHWRLSAAPDTT